MIVGSGKEITNIKLRMILRNLPNNFRLACNVHGNLIVLDSEGNYHGYIDVGAELLEVLEETTE